jgi:hypothetical protein
MSISASRNRRTATLCVVVCAALLVAAGGNVAFAQKKKTTTSSKSGAPAYKFAYEHGYRAGYEDGYAQGKADIGRPQLRDFGQNDLYTRADRSYQQRMGLQLEYQEGYRSGFEIAYSDGYFGRAYSTAIPANLGRVVTAKLNASLSTSPSPSVSSSTGSSTGSSTSPSTGPSTGSSTSDTAGASPGQANPAVTDDRRDQGAYSESGSRSGSGSGSASRQDAYSARVPNDIQMKIRLQDRISTKDSHEGDRFTAVVLDPSTFAEAQLVGHIAKLKKAGNIKGKTELQLSFDSLTLRDGRTLGMSAQVERVYESKGVKQTDEEGNVQTGDRTNDAILRSGGGAVLGAIIGGIAGGGKGAGIGAAIGAGAGIGSVYIDGGKNLTLEPGTEILIRTASPTK